MTTVSKPVLGLAILAALLGASALSPANAQTSASYKLQESSLDNGGHPVDGTSLASSHYHISLDAIGDAVARAGLASASFHLDVGFVEGYSPAVEVTGLVFTNSTTLQWNPSPSAIRYEVYRATSSPGAFGSCFASDLTSPTVTDASAPSPAGGFFYFVTARNRLLEEGPKGYSSNGALEPNPVPCP